MSTAAREKLEKRARAARARDAIRRFEYRQRHHARGVWFRFRRLLSQAETAWLIAEEDARQLLAEGLRPQGVGLEIEPSIQIFAISEKRLLGITSRRPLAIRLSAELLTSRHLALVLWPEEKADGLAD